MAATAPDSPQEAIAAAPCFESTNIAPPKYRLRSDERRTIETLLARRTQLAVPLSIVFVLFSVLDWIAFPEHAERWLIYRLGIFALVFIIDGVASLSRLRRGFGLASLYALAFASAISLMTYESGGFDSQYYVGLLVLAAALFVLFPMECRRGITILSLILAPYLLLSLVHGGASLSRMAIHLTFLLTTGGFLVLGGHLSTRLLIEHHRAEKRMRGLIIQLEDRSRRDPLTQLFNRRYLNERLASGIPTRADQPPLSFAIADIDQFKRVNDRFGHQAGDRMLIEVADAIRASIRNDDVVFRYGGEEFAIVFPATNARGARSAAERLRSTIEELQPSWQGVTLELRLSIGVTTAVPGERPETVIGRADKALYRAKGNGRNQVVSGS